MAEESLRRTIDDVLRRVQDEVDAYLAALESRHREELDNARHTAADEVEQRWMAKLDEVKAEWTARLESEVAGVRADTERRMVAESMRLRVEAEQSAAESALRAREDFERAIEDVRHRASEQLLQERQLFAHERDDLQRQLQEVRQRLSGAEGRLEELRAARSQAEQALDEERRSRREEAAARQRSNELAATEARVAERQSQLAVVERLLSGLRSLDAARSLSQVLSELLSAAAAEAPRVALFLVTNAELKPWKSVGFGSSDVAAPALTDSGLLAEVIRRGEPLATSDMGPAAPPFAALPSDRAAIAVPLIVGAQPVAVLYADDANDAPPQAPASWPEAVQILCRHAAVSLSYLTAARTAEAMRRAPGRSPSTGSAGAHEHVPVGDSYGARRYARLLVSEIKLYNEPAVRIGRENRDLLARLKPEIDRARRLYEQRISSSVDSRGAFFQQELVQTLADGDPALLGSQA